MIVEPRANLLLPPSVQFRPVASYGPFRQNELIPFKGIHLLLAEILTDGDTFRLSLIPHSLTAGYIKRVTGKKGKPAAKAGRSKRASRYIPKSERAA